MSATQHRIAALICAIVAAFAVVAIIVGGVRADWQMDASTSFGKSDNAPLWLATIAFAVFALVLAAAAVWQLRLSRR
jgi:hypothetical protein